MDETAFAEILARGIDPALDPLLWRDAGGNGTVATTTVISRATVGLARLHLPRAMCVMVQINGQATRHVPSSRLMAQVDWQTGRGNHSALVDIGPGCTFTVAAAEAVDIVGILDTGGAPAAASVALQCTLAPGSAANPIPAHFSDVRKQVVAAGGTFTSTPPLPAFARRMQLLLSSQALWGAVVLEIQASATALQQITVAPGEWVDIPSNGETYKITNNDPANNVNVIPYFELAL